MAMTLQWPGRDRTILLGGIAATTLMGWFVLGRLNAGMGGSGQTPMAGMMMHAAAPVGYGMALATWMVMMVAMMAPTVGPGASAYLALARHRQPARSAIPPVLGFSAGYLAVWFAYATLGAGAQWALAQAASAAPTGMGTTRFLDSAILMIVGIYQLTPLKRICVARCRDPLLQLMSSWRDGVMGAIRLGSRQGQWCVGCCWALMALMFVTGAMNLTWMALLAAFILIEKLVPAKWHLDTIAGLLLLAWGAWPLLDALLGGSQPMA